MTNNISKIILETILILLVFLPISPLVLRNLEFKREFVFAQLSPIEERQQLEKELKELEEKINQYESDITKTQAEKKTLQNQISILKKKIGKLDLQIKQNNTMIKDLGLQIKDTETSIDKTTAEINKNQIKLVQLLRQVYEEDQKTLVEIFLAEEKISDFFDNVVALNTLTSRVQNILVDVRDLKIDLEKQKQNLDDEKEDLERLRKIQILQKEELNSTKKEQEVILENTKGKESLYQKSLQETKKRAAEIRARIFELIGVPKAPTFGEAYEIAKYVSQQTGVRPAFLLAILTQESNIGKNVGQCYLSNAETGAGIRISSGKIEPKTMSPRRDVPHFLTITQELGRDSYKTLVSCPMSFGWGGAMGPAQFIPSTWVLYSERLKAIIGKAPDPWNIRDAFLAAGLYLQDYGAASQNENQEWKAAMIYFSGSVNTKYRFYADSVLSIARRYEEDIKAIEKN